MNRTSQVVLAAWALLTTLWVVSGFLPFKPSPPVPEVSRARHALNIATMGEILDEVGEAETLHYFGHDCAKSCPTCGRSKSASSAPSPAESSSLRD